MTAGSGRFTTGRRRALAITAVVGAAMLSLLAVLFAIRVSRIADDLREARRLLRAASSAVEDGRLADARSSIGTAQQLLVSANDALYTSVELDLIDWMPVARQNIEALRDAVGVSLVLADGGRRVLTAAAPLEADDGTLEIPMSSGRLPLDAVTATRAELAALAASLPGADQLESSRFVVGVIDELQQEIIDEVRQRRPRVDNLARALTVLEEMAGGNGSRRYLLAIANTAEMRGSGGMILSYGVLQGADGDFTLGAFGRIDELAVAEPVDPTTVGVPEDYLARWSGFDVMRRWRNATMAADLSVTAPVLGALYEKSTGDTVDGIIQIDPQGLAAILEGIGSVDVAELGRVHSGNVVSLTLNEAYARFPDIDERSDVLGDVAEAVFRRLVNGEYDSIRPLAEALVAAVDGRHIQVHVTRRSVQDQVRFFRAGGALPTPDDLDAFHLTVQNVSANKLDYYVDTSLRLAGERARDRAGRIDATIVVSNRAPPGVVEPRYVFGPFNEQQAAGVYRGVVSLYVPTGTSLEDFSGRRLRGAPIEVSEAGRPVVSFTVDVPAGTSARIDLRLRLAPVGRRPYELVLVPSPRVRPTTVRVDSIRAPDGVLQGEVVLDRTWILSPGQRPRTVAR